MRAFLITFHEFLGLLCSRLAYVFKVHCFVEGYQSLALFATDGCLARPKYGSVVCFSLSAACRSGLKLY